MTRHRRLSLVLLAGAALSLSACGLRVPHDQVLAQYGPGSAGTGTSQDSASGGGGTTTTTDNGNSTTTDPGSTTTDPGSSSTTTDPGSSTTSTDPGSSTTTTTGNGASNPGTTSSQPNATSSKGPNATSTKGTKSNSNNTTASAKPTAAGAIATTGVATGTPVVVGYDATQAGVSSIGVSGKNALQAWANYVNKNTNGLNGHPVTIVSEDNGGDANRALSDVEDLVNNKHAIALIPGPAADESVYKSFVESKGIPVIGGFQLGETWWNSPVFFPQGTDTVAEIQGYDVIAAQVAHKTKMAILYCVEGGPCQTDANEAAAYAPKVGVTIAFQDGISVATPDFTTECLKAQGDGVTAMLVLADAATLQRVANNCSSQGYAPTFIGDPDNSLPANTALNGMYGVATDFAWTDNSTPATALFQKVMSAAGINPDPVAAGTWSGGEELRLAVQRSGSANVTPASIIQGMQTFKNETLGGMAATPGMTFAKGANAVKSYCETPMIIANKAWKSAGAPICANP